MVFLQYCIKNNIDTITYNIFKEFAEKYNIKEQVIILWDDIDYELAIYQEAPIEDIRRISASQQLPSESEMFKYIASVTVDLAADQNPREFADFVKFMDKDGSEIKSKVYTNDKLTMYERDVIRVFFFLNLKHSFSNKIWNNSNADIIHSKNLNNIVWENHVYLSGVEPFRPKFGLNGSIFIQNRLKIGSK